MEKAISERAVSIVIVVFRVELIEAVPTELVFALNALHEFAAARPYNTNLTLRAHLGRKQFIKVAENSQFPYIKHFLKVSHCEGRKFCVKLSLCMPFKGACRAFEWLSTDDLVVLVPVLLISEKTE